MEVNNHTPFPHFLFRTGLEGNKIAAAIMVRVTYDIVNGEAIPSEEQVWRLYPAPWQSPYGPMEGDFVFKRGGVDLFVFGSARAPYNQPVKRMDVNVLLPGKINHTITIFGDRVWQSGFTGLKISDPKPFTEIPLTLANAYGGFDEWDQLAFPYWNNSHGKGFIWEKENAVGKPLPNIEDPKNLITKWNDRPHPVGLTSAPMCEKRVRKAVEFDSTGKLTNFDASFFNAAFPELVANNVEPGEEVFVEGVSPFHTFKFKVPEHTISADLVFDNQTNTRPLFIDQIGLEPDEKRAFITYRYSFNYGLKPLTKRALHIRNF